MKSVFGFRVRLGNPDLDFENLNPDFPIERVRTLLKCPEFTVKFDQKLGGKDRAEDNLTD